MKFVDSGADDDEYADDEGGLRPIAEEEEIDDERQMMSGPEQSQDLYEIWVTDRSNVRYLL